MGNHRRFFINPENINGDIAIIDGSTARQITKVLRLKEGDEICLLDGHGNEYCAKISSLSKNTVTLSVVSTTICPNEPQLQLTLAMCLPKADKLETIIQKCTELGASDFVIVYSERTITHLDDSRTADRLIRWSKIAAEAAEQSGRGKVPGMKGIIPYSSLLGMINSYQLTLLAWEEEKKLSLRDVMRENACAKSVMLIIGPEGGITEQEAESAKSMGARCVSLGKRVLRTETAAIAATTVIMYELEGEL